MTKAVPAALSILLLVTAAVSADEAEPIKIGALYPTSGSAAVFGVPALIGHDMAVEEINAAGGLLGRQLVTVARDTKLKPATASAAAKELITKEGVDVLVGSLSSAVGLAIAEVARTEKVVFVVSIAKTIQLSTTKKHDYVFRTAANTDTEGRGIARVVGTVGGRKICHLQFDYAYGHDLGAGFKRALTTEAPEAEIVLDLKIKLGTTDYNAYIAQVIGSDCDCVASGLWGAAFINIAQQGRPFGLFERVTYVTGGEIGSHEIASEMKGDFPDNVWTNAYELWYHSNSPMHASFQEELSKRFDTPHTPSYPTLGYIGVKFLAAAIEKAGSTDPDALSAAFKGLSIDTPVGRRTINPDTHQANTGQFWGPMKRSDEFDFRVMDPVTYIPGD
jgi:ABC-type branched-subunit amino acid transport system substrate-binding protein